MAANILVTFTADSDSLDASVKQATKDIAVIGDKAAEAGKKASDSFKDAGKSAAAAFSSGQVKAAIDSQVKSIDSLKAGIKKLYDEEIKLLSAGQKQSAAYKKNIEDAAKLRAELQKLTAGTTVYGNETGKVEKAALSLKTQLKNLKTELSNLEAQGQENSKAFQETAFAAARLEDQIGDTNERVRVLASDTFKFDAAVGAIKGLAAGFSIAQGAIAIFGEENKDLQKVIAQTQGAIALLTGLQEAANLITGQGATKIAFQNIFMKEKVVTTYAAATATEVLAGAEEGAAVATLTTVKSLNLLKLAIAGTGIGLLVIGLVALYKAWEDSNIAAAKTKKIYDDAAESTKNLRQENKEFTLQLERSNDQLLVARGLLSEADAKRREANRTYTDEVVKGTSAQFGQIEELKKREEDLLKVLGGKIKAQEYLREQDKKFSTESSKLALQNAEASVSSTRKQYQEQVKVRLDLEKELGIKIKGQAQVLQNDLSIINQEETDDKKEKLKKQAEASAETYQRFREFAQSQFKDVLKFEVTFNDALLAVQKERIDKQLQLIKDFNVKKSTLDLTSQEESLNQRATFLKAEEAIGEGGLDNRINIIKTEAAARVAAIRTNLGFTRDAENQIRIINADAQKAITAETQAESQKRIDTVFQYAEAVSSAFSSLNELSKQQSENRIADITASSDAELKAINDSTNTERQKERERTALAKRTAMVIAAEKTRQAKQDKALALFNAIIGSAAAVAAAKSIPLKVIMAIAGAAQIAVIASKPIPKFEKGGVVGGQRHSQGGTMIEAERDEFIINRNQSVKHRQELNAMNTSSDAFKKLIHERYVRPAVMSYMMQDKRRSDGVTVNAKLDSRSMESELKGLRKDIRKSARKTTNNSIDTRYSWQ